MNIAIGLVSLEAGGTEFQMCLLADGLRSRGHTVTLYLLSDKSDYYMTGQFGEFLTRTTPPIRIPRILPRGFKRLYYYFILLIRILLIRQWIREDKTDIIITALPHTHLLFSLASIGLHIPLIARRGANWSEIDHYPSFANIRRYIRFIRLITSHNTNLVVCNAHHVAQCAKSYEGWPSHKVVTIPNGWPECSSISHTSTRAVYAGRDREEKSCLVPGVERVKGMPDWFNIGIYVHPTKSEGCSNSIGMAMAHGIPVICYDIRGNRELLGDCGLYAYQGPGGIEQWVGAAKDSFPLRAKTGILNQTRVRTHFSLKSMVDSWEETLRSVL